MIHSLIGLEIHGYLDTKEKLFCTCPNAHNMKKIKPNTNVCPVCTGQPGSKPMAPNASAIDKSLQIALILNCTPSSPPKPLVFQRKHYAWPDMPTGYQKTISGAHSDFVAQQGKFLNIRIRELHLEEDPAAWNPETGLVDYNRAGVPLIEIVTEPDFHTAEEVEQWLHQLLLTLSYIKALNKDAGIKADVNVNIKGVSMRTEIKNVNSITEIGNAIRAELQRHEKEKPKKQETRRWNAEKKKTELMRTKENQEDYRFIPDPDLPGIVLTKKRIATLKKSLPETPQEKLEKLIKKHKIPKKEATILIQNLDIAELYETVVKKINPTLALQWITIELFSVLNYNKTTIDQLDISPDHIIELLTLLEQKKLTPLKAQEILRSFVPTSFSPKKELSTHTMISDTKKLETVITKILKENKKSVEDYKAGEMKALNFLIGKVMHATNKRADYKIVKEVLEKSLT